MIFSFTENSSEMNPSPFNYEVTDLNPYFNSKTIAWFQSNYKTKILFCDLNL